MSLKLCTQHDQVFPCACDPEEARCRCAACCSDAPKIDMPADAREMRDTLAEIYGAQPGAAR